ncbi:DUF2247 family protein [Pseudomonas sp. B2M1-30]|uniref:DUF2247 family protein n=1 Tax=Pseudomonas TaxID=286 RepID=UPI0021C895F1|nr:MULTISPECIES: DUF2247 family protein [Pseudomonas]MCU0122213.1 DUF2247 family protein [Pseudomonas sp. B2M1-30]MCU7264466.1 DUF2247 family protein [Pseudomonas koreensis]
MPLLPLDGNYAFSKAPWLTWKELLFGLNRGYIDEEGVSKYVCNTLTESSSEKAYELASLEPEELSSAYDLLDFLADKNEAEETEITKPWIFLLLSHYLDNKHLLKDPLETIEDLYAEFDYPEEISSIVRYMPPPEGVDGSEVRIYENWKNIISNHNAILAINEITEKIKLDRH